jgi:signal peptidase I
MQNLEYVPYLSFEGDMSGHVSDKGNSILFRQMYQPRGKLTFSQGGAISGEVFNGKEWIKDDPLAQNKPHKEIETYSDIFGMRNFAETRLLTKEELKAFPEGRDGNFEVAELYLQLRHTPSLNYPKPLISRGIAGGLAIPGYKAILPLQQKHLEALMDTLYTARFVVKDGRAIRYSHGDSRMGRDAVDFSGVEDGTYEFYHGKAVKIGWAGVTEEVPATSPLYSRSAANIQKLFNLGIEMSLVYQPTNGNETHYPHRYAYFRHGDLYLMGSPVVRKEDPALIAFNKREEEKVAKATNNAPYVAFKDWGAPVKDDGSIDVDFIRTFGVTLPEKSYLVLGDNHAMSADSRVFGFVPEANLQGAPCWIIWPISFAGDCRLGAPPQKPYPFMNVPRAIIWSIAGMIFLIWYCLHRRNLKKRIFIKQ